MGLNYLSSSDNFCPFFLYNLKKRTKNNSASDYMLETILFEYYLLFIYTFYLYIDASKNNILSNSENNETFLSDNFKDTQSAENCKGFSETARQLPVNEDYKF